MPFLAREFLSPEAAGHSITRPSHSTAFQQGRVLLKHPTSARRALLPLLQRRQHAPKLALQIYNFAFQLSGASVDPGKRIEMGIQDRLDLAHRIHSVGVFHRNVTLAGGGGGCEGSGVVRGLHLRSVTMLRGGCDAVDLVDHGRQVPCQVVQLLV